MNWDLYRFFLAVAESGSLSTASLALAASQPTVGRKIAELESELGYSLFLRSTRGLILTQEGIKVREQALKIGASIEGIGRLSMEAEVENSGIVRLSTSEGIGMHWVMGLLPLFSRQHPRIHLEMIVSYRSVDLTKSEADVAFRLGIPGADALYARRVANVKFGLYASLAYLERKPPPKTAEDLAHHSFVGMSGNLAKFEPSAWFNSISHDNDTIFSSDSLNFNRNAAEQGMGIALISCLAASRSSDLVHLLPELDTPVLPLWLVTHPETRNLKRVKAVVQFIAAQAELAADLFSGTSESGSSVRG